MKALEMNIKLSYITGLKPVVLKELETQGFFVQVEGEDCEYIDFSEDSLSRVKHLRSVARAYLVVRGGLYNPLYISNHKSVLATLVDQIVEDRTQYFGTFSISCAGADSPEVQSISHYIQETYGLIPKDEADLKIHIIKNDDTWEVGAQITPRPLSVRDYRAVHMSGAMDPTVACAVNSLCFFEGSLEAAHSYLNVFSGSGTLLIEAAQCYKNLETVVGFDRDKKHLSISIQNIKKAGLISTVQVKEADIFDMPDFGTFDVITSDLPFGMVIGKHENLELLYKTFVEYCEKTLRPDGRLVVYTSEHEIFRSVLAQSRFEAVQTLQLKFMTAVHAYLRPQIIVCEFKK